MNRLLLLGTLLAVAASPVRAQETPSTVSLSLEEAVEIAVAQNYALRNAALTVEDANAQVRAAWGQLYPQADASAGYTRNIVSANPFAGSDAGNIFGTLGWLISNEIADTDDDPTTSPVPLQEFLDRPENQGDESSNPFSVPNQIQTGISISQTLFSGAAFAAVRGADELRAFSQAALATQQQAVIFQTRQLYYSALLAQEQVRVLRASVERNQMSVNELTRQVVQGVLPKFERLSAEVALANLSTQHIQAEAAAENVKQSLLLTLGLPVDRGIILEGALAAPPSTLIRQTSAGEEVRTALLQRPDLDQARLAVRLQEVQRNITRAQYYPTVTANLTAGYGANMPDNLGGTGFFSTDFWQPSVTAGLSVRWNIFNGFQTRYQMQQRQIAIAQARVQVEQAEQGAQLEVHQALRDLRSAQERLSAQQQNVENATLAYEFASSRLENGVATPLQLRDASTQLDQARLNVLQATHDLLIAWTTLERAMGTLVVPSRRPASPLTVNR